MNGKNSSGETLLEVEKIIRNTSDLELLRNRMKTYYDNSSILTLIVRNPRCDEQLLKELSKHENDRVRYEVALQAKKIKDEKILYKLAMDSRMEVRAALRISTVNEGIKKLIDRLNKNNKKYNAAMEKIQSI